MWYVNRGGAHVLDSVLSSSWCNVARNIDTSPRLSDGPMLVRWFIDHGRGFYYDAASTAQTRRKEK